MPTFRFESDGTAMAPHWAMPACGASAILRCDAGGCRVEGESNRQFDDPLTALNWLAEAAANDTARWVGYLSYDLGRLFESIPSEATDDLSLPLFCFARCGDSLQPRPEGRGSAGLPAGAKRRLKIQSTFSRNAYLDAVNRCIEYVCAGDVFQINLSQRFTTALNDDPQAIAQRLPPARHGAYLEFDDHAIISNSPELFLRVTPDRRVITRPIKGTRPRLPGMEEQLRLSVKDQAELNMIVDLERNDLGRVCETGSVRVTEPRTIEAHPTVYHGVSTIEGRLREDIGFVDLLRATFPGGSITGAPKIRAMQIIDELEPVRRGPYCGAIGYLAPGGAMEFNIAIRTMIVKDGLVHFSVGGGIVADSEASAEYDETLVKARAIFNALGISEEDLHGS